MIDLNDPTAGLQQQAQAVTLVLAVVLGLLILLLPRKYAIVPIVLTTCFLPVGGKYVVFGLNFSMLRVVLFFAGARIVLRKEWESLRWVTIDSVVLAWAVCRVLGFTLLWQNSAALVNGAGYAYDEIGLYLMFRILLTEMEQFKQVLKVFAIALLPLAILMCVERVTGRDPFFFLGGVPEFPEVREGITRCQGPFGHPILAGTFGAAWLPLLVGLWLQGKGNRLIASIGLLSCTLITIMSGSSGPIGSYIAGLIGLSMWRIRTKMRTVRWGIVACILALHLVMKDPVWFIFARINVLSGSTGWHRANLIDRCVAHFSEWWLVGAKDIARWGVFAGDSTNQFIAEGIRAGILTMALFIWVIVIAFSYSGNALKQARMKSRRHQLLLWSMGVCLFVHVVSFLSVSYFDQNIVGWFFILAMTATAFCTPRALNLGPKVVKEAYSSEHYDSPSYSSWSLDGSMR